MLGLLERGEQDITSIRQQCKIQSIVFISDFTYKHSIHCITQYSYTIVKYNDMTFYGIYINLSDI